MMTTFIETPWGMVNDTVPQPMFTPERETKTFAEPHTVMTKEQQRAKNLELIGEAKKQPVNVIKEAISQAIARQGHEGVIEYTVSNMYGEFRVFSTLTVDGESTYDLDIKEEWGGVSWKQKPTGKYFISVGNYGRRERFKQRKDGTFRYDDIANVLIRRATEKKNEQKKAVIREMGRHHAEKLRDELDVREYAGDFSITSSSSEEHPILVSLNIKKCMKADDVRALHKFLKEMNMI